MSLYSPRTMTNTDLVAAVLGKGAGNEEAARVAHCLLAEEAPPELALYHVANQYGTAAIKRADRVLAAIELTRRINETKVVRTATQVNRPEAILELMAPRYEGEHREVFYVVCLNAKHGLKQVEQVAIGSLNAAIVHPRELFERAIRVHAAAIVITHNHPSGDPTPSGADIQLTHRLVKAGGILGIDVLDHVVIGGGETPYFSLSDAGLM